MGGISIQTPSLDVNSNPLCPVRLAYGLQEPLHRNQCVLVLCHDLNLKIRLISDVYGVPLIVAGSDDLCEQEWHSTSYSRDEGVPYLPCRLRLPHLLTRR